MKRKSLTENFIYNIIYQLFVTALPVLTTPYTARVLGLQANGNHAYTESIVTYFIILGFIGTALYGTRKIAYVSHEPSELVATTWEIIWLRLLLMILTLAIYIPLLCISNEFVVLYRIQIINIIAAGIDLSWFYQGVEDFKRVTIRNLLVKMVYVLSLFIFIKKPSDLNLYVTFIVSSAFVGNLLMWFFLNSYLGKGGCQPPRRLLLHLRGSFGLFLPQVTNYIYSLLDRSMLKWMTGSTDFVTIYDQGQRLIRAMTAIMQSVGYVMLARLSNLQATQNTDDIKKYIHQSLNLTLFFAMPAMFGLASVAKDFVPLFLGTEYSQVTSVLRLLCPLLILIPINSVLGVQLLISIGRERQYTIATTVGASVNTCINLLLLPPMNVIGACISSLCAETMVFLVLYFASKDYISFTKILRDNAIPFLTSIAMFIIVLLLSKIQLALIPKLLVEISVGIVIYLSIMILSKNKILFFVYNKFVNRFRKGNEY